MNGRGLPLPCAPLVRRVLIATVFLTFFVPSPCLSARQDARDRARVFIAKAEAALDAGRAREAVAFLEQAEKEAPDWPELKVNLAAARSSAGDYVGAAAAARAALALDPSLDGARFNLGLALLKSGDPSAAAVALAPYADAPAPAAVHAALGLAWLQLDRAADAAPILQRAIDAGQRDTETLLAAGRAWFDSGDTDRAAGVLEIIRAESDSSSADVHLLAGDIADARQDWNGAVQEYQAAVTLDPRSLQAVYSLGLAYYKLREYDSAARLLSRALELAADHVPSLYYLGLLELDRGAPERGAALMARAAEAAPRRADIARDLGRARLDLDDPAGALEPLRRATSLDPSDPSAWFLLGRALKGTGASDEAGHAFARSTELNQELRERLEQRVSGAKKPGGG